MNEGTREYYEKRILRVQMHIQKHLDEQLLLEELADVACFSPWHFHRIFSAMTGESLMEYMRRLRLERAAQDLRYSARFVTDIAFDAGYETHESFTRAFRRKFGLSPSAYRVQHRDQDNRPSQEKISGGIIRRYEGMNMEVKIENFETMTVVSVRHTGPYEECHTAWQKLCSNESVLKYAEKNSLGIGICYDNPEITEPDKIRYDACITVKKDFVPGEGIIKQEIKGGIYAVITHKGSFDGLHDCYRWFYGEWLPASGYEPGPSPSLEIYRNNPDTTPPDELVTDICFPLEKG